MIEIQRKPLTSTELNSLGGRQPTKEKTLGDIKRSIKSKKFRWRKAVNQYLPFTDWLFHYKLKEDFVADIVAGVTIAIMNVPQGMAYALLAGVPAIYGLYTSIFPVIVYCIFGPSKHISMGTNPLTSILTASAILAYLGPGTPEEAEAETEAGDGEETFLKWINPSRSYLMAGKTNITEIQIATSLSLLVGCWQTLFSFLKLGKLSWILSDVLVSGYTTGAAFHVLASQLKGIFGVPIKEPTGYFVKFFLIVIDLFKQITDTNVASLLIAIVCIIVLVINDEILKPRVAKKCSLPIPIQLIVVVLGTVTSSQLDFKTNYNVSVVGEIQTTGPEITPPIIDKELFGALVVNSIIIAVVGYCVTLSMAKIYANKFAYKIDGNQEMLAEGLSNLAGCFFQSVPSGASMSRTSVQVAVGGRTQLTSIVSIGILFVVIYKAGELFEELPKAVLSAIIVVALKGMFMQVYDLPKFASRSKLDGALWLASVAAVLLMDIDTGLVIGIALSLLLLLYRSIAVPVDEMGLIEETSVFANRKVFANASRRSDAIILQIGGPISFANFEDVFEKLRRKLKHIPRTVPLTHLILDMSAVSYVDQSGGKAFKDWLKKDDKIYKKCLAAATSHVEEMLLKLEVDSKLFFPTVLDAVAQVESGFVSRDSSHTNIGYESIEIGNPHEGSTRF